MNITVINGTEKRGVTWRLKELFLEPFRDSADITEFYLPEACPAFCSGCTSCFAQGEDACKDADYIRPIAAALDRADLLVFTSPAYVFHVTGGMKALLDHLAYRWMPHRPSPAMFGKRAVILTQCLGGGGRSAAQDIRHSLSWWGVSHITVCAVRLMEDIQWDALSPRRQAALTAKLRRVADRASRVRYGRPARAGLSVRLKFFACRLIQRKLCQRGLPSPDSRYWAEQGWLDRARPWKIQ